MLGLKGLVVKTHGSSKATEVCNSIIQCVTFKEQAISAKIEEAIQLEKEQEETKKRRLKEERIKTMEFEKIQKIIAEEMNLNVEDVKPESRFVEDLAADSLDVIQIVLKLEEEFDIEIPDDAVEQISTVQDAVDQIKSKKNA